MAKLLFCWLPRLDPLMGEAFTVDGASCVFFLGKKSTSRIGAAEAIAHYGGAQ